MFSPPRAGRLEVQLSIYNMYVCTNRSNSSTTRKYEILAMACVYDAVLAPLCSLSSKHVSTLVYLDTAASDPQWVSGVFLS